MHDVNFADHDNDGILSSNDDLDGDGNVKNDDTDGDLIPNYLDADDDGSYSKERAIKNILLVTITSNRGLCGGFNSYIIKSAKALMNDELENVNLDANIVAERIASPPGNKTYGILSVLIQAFYDIEYLFTVSENVFSFLFPTI